MGVFLDYFDIAYDTCRIDSGLEKRLGYKRILIAQKDLKIIDNGNKKDEIEGNIFINGREENLVGILNMNPCAIIFSDSKINKKALEQMKERDTTLCIPLGTIISSYGLQRSKNLYLTSKLLDYALGMKIDVSFATFAKSNTQLCSYMQVIEIAKLLGATEEYARNSLNKINPSLVIE